MSRTGLLSSVLAADPLLVDVDFGVVLIVIAKVLVTFGLLLVAVMLMIWFERKIISDLQNRIGPTVAGPFGLLQTLADGVKAFFKEDLIPDKSDRFVFKLAPYLAFVPAFVTFCVIPLGATSRTRAAPSRSATTSPSSSWPTRRWGCSSSSPCRRSPCTA